MTNDYYHVTPEGLLYTKTSPGGHLSTQARAYQPFEFVDEASMENAKAQNQSMGRCVKKHLYI
jgi:hypothetical protein